ncbi:MAG: hypothetical protein ABJB76_08625 [Candidatus Nitrosocosmicus sp.]
MKVNPASKIINFFTKVYTRYSSTISINKNLLLSGICGYIISFLVAFISTKYSTNNFTNSGLIVIIGFIFAKAIFVILFHHDNKKKYTNKVTGKLNFYILKQIVKKMVVADSVFDIIDTVARFLILLELLRNQFQPIQAAIISSIIASSLSYLAINLIVKYINVFGSTKKKAF